MNFLQTQELPKLTCRFHDVKKRELQVRNQLLQLQLRLAHIKKFTGTCIKALFQEMDSQFYP